MQRLKLHSIKQRNKMRDPSAVSMLFKGVDRILYVLARQIRRLTWTRLLAILRSLSELFAVNWLRFFRNVGVLTVTSTGANISCAWKPLSVIRESPGSSFAVNELRSVSILSLAAPSKASGMCTQAHLAIYRQQPWEYCGFCMNWM